MRPRQGARHFALRRFEPGPPVARNVENYWAVRWDLPGRLAYRQEIIPHPCVNVTVESGSPGEVRHGFAMPAALLHGLPTRRFAVDLIGTGRVLGVRFRPGGFAALTGHSAGVLRDRVVPLGQVFGGAAETLASEVLAEEADERRVELTEAFLCEHLPDSAPGYDLVLALVTEMLEDRSLVRVGQLTRRHGVSERTLQRLFRHYVGASRAPRPSGCSRATGCTMPQRGWSANPESPLLPWPRPPAISTRRTSATNSERSLT